METYSTPTEVRAGRLTAEALFAFGLAALLASLLAAFGPPGSDLAAHVYQSGVFRDHGFQFWNNFWYEGRYSFVTYSLLYYAAASLVGIQVLAVLSIATAALAFSVIAAREWGHASRWSSVAFAVVWAGVVLSGAYPFALGATFALLALWALQSGGRVRFAVLTVLCFAASPLAFALLALLLAAIGLARLPARAELLLPAATVGAVATVWLVLWRVFPAAGRFPFSIEELAAVCVFCILGIVFTWRVQEARVLRWLYVLYLPVCVTAFLVPSSLGENIARLRFAAVPLAILTLSLRRWRPLPLAAFAFLLALAWNVSPLAASYAKGASDPASDEAYWAPAIGFLNGHLGHSYRVEVVDTTGHWAAAYLPAAGIPITRGWFRQDDFPRNEVLYRDEVGARSWIRWLRQMAVRYVVLPDAPLDYSSAEEAELLRSGRTGLTRVFRSAHTTVYAVPAPRKLVTGPGRTDVLTFGQSRVTFTVAAAGRYRVAMSWSPYWKVSRGCLERDEAGMTVLDAPAPGAVTMRFTLKAGRALATLAGRSTRTCAR
ncbi:MAG TPA: hypothetical protein VM049_06010 [Gaiellaceae bacterium]|nr:hypothetical protein [Gaiellaceae bacterium]